MVQSSSITTVMVIGFVNSGVMELSQAIGVIIGANVGTTVTGWFLALKIGKYGLPLLGGAAFVYLFSKGDRWRFWAMAIMGTGMVFFGLDSMQDELAVFVTNLLANDNPHSVADEARQQLRIADEFESISDYVANMDKFDRKLRRDGHRFTPDQRAALTELIPPLVSVAYLATRNAYARVRDHSENIAETVAGDK